MNRIPNILAIAGVDPSGGAGILADVKTISANGGYACAVLAALTAQNTRGVTGIEPIRTDFIRLQLDTLFEDVRIDAVKIGMLGAAPAITVVADRLIAWKPPHIVLDPVMVARSGDVLLERKDVAVLREAMLPLAMVITPNRAEAGLLLESGQAENLRDMRRQAEKLRNIMAHDGERWVYLKGARIPGEDAVDLLHDGDRMIELPSPNIDTRNTHGTGCTLSAALATLLPQATDVPTAAREAKAFITRAIQHAGALDVGTGHGPVHHFHALTRGRREN